MIDAFLEVLPTYAGSLCEAGARFAHILPNGDVFRCGARHWQGNILSGTFVRRLAGSLQKTCIATIFATDFRIAKKCLYAS